MKITYPLKMQSVHRPTPWGHEDWLISVYGDKQSTITNGEHIGKKAGKIIPDYPLLIKMLKASRTLSVQVHPNDAQAKFLENEPRGKTEAWVVLRAEKGAKLIYGLRPEIDKPTFEAAAQAALTGDKSIENLLRWIEVAEGDVLFIPAGAIHGLGAGIEVYEVQQSSDRTYRLWDWGFLEKGKLRELHTKKAVEVTVVSFHGEKLPGTLSAHSGYTEKLYIAEEAFTLKRFDVSGKAKIPLEFGIAAITMLGSGRIIAPGLDEVFIYGDTYLIPAELKYFEIHGKCSALCSYAKF